MIDTLALNVKAIRHHLEEKQEVFAERFDAGQSDISKWETGRARPEGRNLATLEKVAGCSIDVLETALWSPRPPLPDFVPTRSADAGETVGIIQLDLSLPMGPGATIEEYVEEELRLFDLAYIRAFTKTPPDRLRLARGVGDSMWPTLQSYDQVWIDTTQNALNHSDRIYAVSINGGAAIKRLRPMEGGRRVLIMSDNPGPGHENYEVDRSEILIAGRVIRYARDL